MKYIYTSMESPVGLLQLITTDKGLTAVLWENDDPHRVRRADASENKTHPVLVAARSQLARYFDGQIMGFSVPLALEGTEFQMRVWQALLTIPYGETRSYGEIARQIGQPTASRAVGAANGKNPVSIIVPCHRVIGGTGKLVGFAGGLSIKARLLELEHRQRTLPSFTQNQHHLGLT
jgi:methylated-DNA-[protein]-cysteine S-methyltransferase